MLEAVRNVLPLPRSGSLLEIGRVEGSVINSLVRRGLNLQEGRPNSCPTNCPARALPHTRCSCITRSTTPLRAAPRCAGARCPHGAGSASQSLQSCGHLTKAPLYSFVVRSNGTARRTRVSTMGKEPDPFVLRTAGNYSETFPVRGGAPRVVAVGSARRRESLSRPAAPS